MLNSTRRLLTEDLHPFERSALVEIVASRGGRADAAALSPRLLTDAEPQWDLLGPVVRHGDAAMAGRLYDRFVVADRLIDRADPQLLWAFGWAGLESARPMLFHYAREPDWGAAPGARDWDMAPAAVNGLVHLSPAGMEDEVRAAVEACVGRTFFPEHLPALAGWIGDAELIDRFLIDDHTSPSSTCMAGVILAIGLLGPAGRDRLHRLFWTSDYPWVWNETPRSTGLAMRLTGLGVADLARELRTRLETDAEPQHWWFSIVRCMAAQQTAAWSAPAPYRFAPPAERPLEMWTAVFGQNDTLEEDLGDIAHQRLGLNGEWLSGEIADLREPLERLVRQEALLAELAPA